MRFRSKAALVTFAAVTTIGLTTVPAQAGSHHTIWVRPGTGTISAAVAKAHPGDTIRLGKGTFYDSVFIAIPLTVRGSGWHKTVVKPPASSDNPCNSPGAMSGFCASGAFDDQGNPDTSHPVKNVTVRDLRVTGFTDTGVLGFNTRGLRVSGVRADHDGGYGVARFLSTKTVFEHNWTSYDGEAGLYMGDSPHADSVVRDNSADHNGIGVFLRDSTEITARGNKVWGNCIGILALNSGEGAPGDLPAGDYTIVSNKVLANNKVCPADEGPPTSGIGIALADVHDTLVSRNEVRDNRPAGPTFASGGILLVSVGGPGPTDNVVVHNRLRNNDPDIFWDGSGSGNKVKHNSCHTATPGNLGWCTH